MSDHLFLVGSYGVQVSDVIAGVALIVSFISASAAIASARANWRNTRREEAKDLAKRIVGSEIHASQVDHEGALIAKVFLVAPQDGLACDIVEIEILNQPRANFAIAGRPWPGVISLKAGNPHLERQQVNLILMDYSVMKKPVSVRFSGRRRDHVQSSVSAVVFFNVE